MEKMGKWAYVWESSVLRVSIEVERQKLPRGHNVIQKQEKHNDCVNNYKGSVEVQ